MRHPLLSPHHFGLENKAKRQTKCSFETSALRQRNGKHLNPIYGLRVAKRQAQSKSRPYFMCKRDISVLGNASAPGDQPGDWKAPLKETQSTGNLERSNGLLN